MPDSVRTRTLDRLRAGNDAFDIIVIGGGITGAGIAREAAGSGLKTLLVEQQDFAWGTSSRSSKMVHGGLRYLGSGHYKLTRDAVRERQRFLSEAPGLVDPLRFVMPHYRKQFPGPKIFGLLLWVYDWIARQASRQFLTPAETLQWVPGLSTGNLLGASGFTDAVTDDARLVMRVLEEARADGALCLNYVKAHKVTRVDGAATGLTLVDQTDEHSGEPIPFPVAAKLIVNATGAWADALRQTEHGGTSIRPLRGSHLIVPFEVLPVSCSVSLLHPDDRRPVFAFPWQGTTVLGTTDLDHDKDLNEEPVITGDEITYLLKAAATLFPGHPIRRDQILGSWSGVRPVVSEQGGKAPSKENREHRIWNENGLVSVAGGKLTTFRLIAREVLESGAQYLDHLALRPNDLPVFRPAEKSVRPTAVSHSQWHRLNGYYGSALPEVMASGELSAVANTDTLWAEVCWAAGHSDVVHLDDLLLRRTRLGMVLPEGAAALLPELQARCSEALGWDEARWSREIHRYLTLWARAYSLPPLPKAAE